MSSLIYTEKKSQLTGHKASVYALAKGEQPGTFYSAGGDGWLVRWQVDEPDMGQLVATAPSPIYFIAPFYQRQLVAAGTMEGGLHWLSLEQKVSIKDIAHHEHGLFAIIPLDNGQALTGGGLGKLSRWDLEELRAVESLHLSHTSIRGLDIQNNKILAACSDTCIHVLDTHLQLLHTIDEAHDNSAFVARWHPSGDGRILSGGRDAQLKVWDAHFQLIHQENAHWFTINDIQFSPNGAIFATASRDKTIRLWNANDYSLLKELNAQRDGGHWNSVNRLLWLDENTLVSASDDRSLIIWDIKTQV